MAGNLDNKTIQSEISNYDADMFRSGTAFSLLESADDELTRERILACMKTRAIAVGIKKGEYDALAKAAKNDMKRREAEERRAREAAAWNGIWPHSFMNPAGISVCLFS